MTSRMHAANANMAKSQQMRQETNTEDVFLLDLEGKIDQLKNVSTDLHSELKYSKTRVDTLRGGLDEAQGYVKDGLGNMSKLMRNKDRDEQFLVKLAAHTTHHITEFLTEEIALLASRYHALDIYDKALFDAIEERVTRHVGRFLTNDAIATLAAFSHFDVENERIRELLKKHIKEQREYLDADDYAERIRSANLSPEDRADLLNSEA